QQQQQQQSKDKDPSNNDDAATAAQNWIGSSPHTDWGLLTLIAADDIPGLQLFDKEKNQWLTVKPRFHHNEIFVNCGDFMSILSNSKFKSPLHRVVLLQNDDKQRLSFVFFFYPNYHAKIPKTAGQQHYSLWEDQSLHKNDPQGQDEKSATKQNIYDISFGEYIKRKWEQVQRKY
ncbi:hypothetical protein RFI_17893, partial [Reticulomyxa filosa]